MCRSAALELESACELSIPSIAADVQETSYHLCDFKPIIMESAQANMAAINYCQVAGIYVDQA